MDETNELSVPIGADPSALSRGMNDAVNIVERSARRINQSLRSISDIGGDLAKLGAALSASVTLPLVALGKQAIEAYGDLQSLELGLEAVAGSATYAAKQLGNLREIAKLPGLGLKEASKGSINLQAIGYSAGSAERILAQFGNAVASVGKGRVEFERAIYGVTQLANTDFPLGEDLNIIKDALPQVSTLLKAAFGTSRSEDLQKLKISSKQVMDVILTGLEKLPRVNGGIKNAFENLGDSIEQNLARVGKSIDKNFDISKIIDKITALLDDLVTSFEELSPAMQKTILIIAGVTAGIGPLLLAIGGFLALVPLIVSGITAIGTAITATIAFMTSWVGIIAGLIIAATALGGAIAYLATRQSEAEQNQENWNKSLSKATASAQAEVSALDQLYKKTQDVTLSAEERNKAIDQAQKEYPGYLGNISDEAFRTGQAAQAYQELRKGILSASIARAAQGELDKRNAVRLQKEIEIREKINKAAAAYKDPSFDNFEKLRSSVEDGLFNFKTIDRAFNPEDIKKVAGNFITTSLKELKKLGVEFSQENKILYEKIAAGAEAIKKLDVAAPDNFLPGLEKVKKQKEKQLAEIFPKGSIAELEQRAQLLKKSIETSVGDLVKIRGLDKFGKEVDKKGNAFLTGEIIPKEEALKRLEQIYARIEILNTKPIGGTSSFSQFRTDFSSELKGLTDDLKIAEVNLYGVNPFDKLIADIDKLGQAPIGEISAFKNAMKSEFNQIQAITTDSFTQIGDSFYYLPNTIGLALDKVKVQTERLKEEAKKFNEEFKSQIADGISSGFSNLFTSIGDAIGKGANVIEAVGNGLLGLFGKFISEMGGLLVKYGTLAVVKGTLDTIITTGGPQSIAAGLAAIAVGAALQIAGSALGSRASAGLNGSSNVSSAAGVTNNGYSGSYISNSGGSSGEVVFRIEGRDLLGVLNREIASGNRLNAN